MGQFNLQSTFLGLGPGTKDLEDQAGAVQHLGLPGLFQIALLNGCQRMVDNDQSCIKGRNQAGKFLHLTGAEQGARLRLGKGNDARMHDVQFNGAGKSLRFFQTRGIAALVQTASCAITTATAIAAAAAGIGCLAQHGNDHDGLFSRTLFGCVYLKTGFAGLFNITQALLTTAIGGCFLIRAIEHVQRFAWHNGRYGMFINQLRVTITTQQQAEIIEPGHNAGQLHAVD